ncbi:MAG: NBR1-Ig-like domain-containing protein [Anaerolineaceae bacterium]
MDIKRLLSVIIIAFFILTAACTIRITSADQDAVKTAVAQTLMAQQPQPTATPQILPTITTLPTITPKPDQPTNTPQPCNKAAAVSETYPDDTEIKVKTNFDKSWRLQNIGTCTWNSNYRVVFYSGDQMGGPNSQSLNTTVAPGEIIDIIIDQTVPNSTGTYKGIWKLQDDSGSNFAQFWIQIKGIAAPALSPAVAALSLGQVSNEGGSVRSDGNVMNALYNAGDLNTNGGSQVFASFNISGIPAGSTITEVKLDFSDFDMLDDPFGDLGCLRAYVQNYGSMDASDYAVGAPVGAIGRWCSSAELQTVAVDDDFKSALQSEVGDTRFQIRLQFNDKTSDNDNNGDMVRFGTILLHVTYELP